MGIIKKNVGDRAFIRATITLVLPIIVQQFITNFVNLLDNIMVGGLGTEPISAVAIVNQLIFVFNLAVFGGVSGASIFGAQFFGNRDIRGVRQVFRYKLIFILLLVSAAICLFLLCGEQLIAQFLQGADGGDPLLTRTLAVDYLHIILIGIVPFALTQVYTSSLRETGVTVAPMKASVLAIGINLLLNWALIYGNLGAPRLGVRGAAIATVIAHAAELIYIVLHTHLNSKRYIFIQGVYRKLQLPAALVRRIIITGAPLMLNEVFWSAGMAFINRCYSSYGLSAIAAVNITATAAQLFGIIMVAMGSAVSIMVGQQLGAGDIARARETDRRLIVLTVLLHIGLGAVLLGAAQFIPLIYNVQPAVRELAVSLLIIEGLALPLNSFIHTAYFSIRSGGKTIVTVLFDSVFTWAVQVSLAYILCSYSSLALPSVYFIVIFSAVIKAVIGFLLLRSGFWARKLVGNPATAAK